MKKLRSILLALLALSLSSATLPAQTLSGFTAGDLVIEEVGNGTTTLTSGATPIFLDEYNTAGVLVGNVALPTTNGSGLSGITDSGAAGTDGMISLSPNGQYIAIAGYNDPVGNTSLTSSTSAAVQRVVGTVSYNATVTDNLLGTTQFNATNIRGAFATDPTDIWANGHGNATTDGIWYSNGTTSTLIANGNLRTIGYAAGQLLAANATAILAPGSGLPTAAGNISSGGSGNLSTPPASDVVLTVPGATLGQFVFVTENFANGTAAPVSGPNTLYVANTTSNTSAILKYTLTSGTLLSGTWTASGSANISASSVSATIGAFGLTGAASGIDGGANIYGTTSGSTSETGNLFGLADTSGYAGSLSGGATQLAAASANETFRGIVFAPSFAAVPEPSTYAALFGAGALGVSLARRRQRAQKSATL